jgi:5-methylcytosine-specific restriction enzyme A
VALRDALQFVATSYSAASQEALTNHPVAVAIRVTLADAIETALGDRRAGLLVEGSPGQGNWARVPWAAIFEPSVTTGATRGFYPVYLFDIAGGRVYLSLNQGTTTVRQEFRRLTQQVLLDRAALMRKRVQDYLPQLPEASIDLGQGQTLAGDYSSGHALGLSYEVDRLPDEARLASDLATMIDCYRALIFRGGLDFGAAGSDQPEQAATVDEERRYRMHRRIERNPKASRLAKAFHGTVCQACGFDFQQHYGAIGAGFIEAHHLTPIASLSQGTTVTYDVATDFAVLCSNCHQMIHRLPDPSDIGTLVSTIQQARTSG